jgi:hypothetical protein
MPGRKKTRIAAIVVDTNVLLVANNTGGEWPPSLVSACAEKLTQIKRELKACVDNHYLILGEYGNQLPAKGRQGMGDHFFVWVAQHHHQITITPLNAQKTHFTEFPELDPELRRSRKVTRLRSVKVTHLKNRISV